MQKPGPPSDRVQKRQPPIASESDEMQMAASVVANEFVGDGNSDKSKPRPSKCKRVGHPERQSPEKQTQFLSKAVQESYHPCISCRQEEKTRKGDHPRAVSPISRLAACATPIGRLAFPGFD